MNAQKEKFLLFRIRHARDEHAFKALLVEHGRPVGRFLRSRLPTEQDADDAFSEMSWRVWNYLTASSDVRGGVIGLFFIIARNVISDFYRKRGQETVSLHTTEGATIDPPARQSEKTMEAEVDLMLVCKVIDKLQDEHREVIILRCFEGLSTREVARRLQKSENAVSIELHRALKELRTHISAIESSTKL